LGPPEAVAIVTSRVYAHIALKVNEGEAADGHWPGRAGMADAGQGECGSTHVVLDKPRRHPKEAPQEEPLVSLGQEVEVGGRELLLKLVRSWSSASVIIIGFAHNSNSSKNSNRKSNTGLGPRETPACRAGAVQHSQIQIQIQIQIESGEEGQKKRSKTEQKANSGSNLFVSRSSVL